MLVLTAGDDTEGGGAEVMPTKVDEKLDGVVIIDAGGSILMVNKVGRGGCLESAPAAGSRAVCVRGRLSLWSVDEMTELACGSVLRLPLYKRTTKAD